MLGAACFTYTQIVDNKSNMKDVTYSPATKEEKAQSESAKEKIVEEKDNQQNANSSATVLITDAAQYGAVIEVRSYVADQYADGTCVINIFKDGYPSITKTTSAYKDATTTICTNPLIDRSEFPVGGQWRVKVSYNSGSIEGSSEERVLVIE